MNKYRRDDHGFTSSQIFIRLLMPRFTYLDEVESPGIAIVVRRQRLELPAHGLRAGVSRRRGRIRSALREVQRGRRYKLIYTDLHGWLRSALREVQRGRRS